ncbi:MAG: hypothetical protein GY913_30330 [Proteobacteria bacterium]|nr:hypothetical protein [Pseudomonadota bacterium]
MILFLLACNGNAVDNPDDSDPQTTDSGDTGDTGDPYSICDDLPQAPYDTDLIKGYTASEDFAFDGEGNVLSVEWNGNLVSQNYDGDTTVIVPRFGEAAGMEIDAEGRVVVCNVENGTIERVSMDGSAEVINSGIPYPNGLTIDHEGFIYVSEHSVGKIRRIDPETFEYERIAEDLYAPNGMAFSPDWQTLYVNSFGEGTVHALHREGDGWSDPVLLGSVLGEPEDPCGGRDDGAVCVFGDGIGSCETEVCVVPGKDRAACEGLAEADPCVTEFDEQSIESICTADDTGLFCPLATEAELDICDGKTQWENCGGGNKYCMETSEDLMACVNYNAWTTEAKEGCADLGVGDACTVTSRLTPYEGSCIDYGDNRPYCIGDDMNAGGLDGLDVDECGNVYVTEYIAGKVYRFAPEGGEPEEILDVSSSWIPNLHWGRGVGGFESNVLYMMDRDTNGIFTIDVGFEGRPTAADP